MKKCGSCKLTKEAEFFFSNKAKRDGLSATCRECERFRKKYIKRPKPKQYRDYLKEAGYSRKQIEQYQRNLKLENYGLGR